jgi:SET domain/AWS domain
VLLASGGCRRNRHRARASTDEGAGRDADGTGRDSELVGALGAEDADAIMAALDTNNGRATTRGGAARGGRARSVDDKNIAASQKTPKEGLEDLAGMLIKADRSKPLFTIDGMPQAKGGVVPLRGVDGCSALTKHLSLLQFVSYLCLAHGRALNAFARRLRSAGDGADVEALYAPPDIKTWRDVIAELAGDSTLRLPLIESLKVTCSLAAGLVPGRSAADPCIDAARETLTAELYASETTVSSILALVVGLCDAVNSLPAHQLWQNTELLSCFEMMAKLMQDIFAFELSSRETPTAEYGRVDSDGAAAPSRGTGRTLSNLFLYHLSREHATEGSVGEGAEASAGVCPGATDDGFAHICRQCLGLETLMCTYFTCLARRKPSTASFRQTVVKTLTMLAFAERTASCYMLLPGSPVEFGFREEMKRCIAAVTETDFFWNSFLTPFMRKVSVRGGTAFQLIGPLLSHDSFIRNLVHEKNAGPRDAFLKSMIAGALSSYAKSPISPHPIVAPEVTGFYCRGRLREEEVLLALLRHSVVQREALCGRDQEVKNALLTAIEDVLIGVDRVANESRVSVEEVQDFLDQRRLSIRSPVSHPLDHSDDNSTVDGEDDGEESSRHLNQRFLCFAAKLIGYCGKSFTDGNWNPDHQCMLSSITQTGGTRYLSSLCSRLLTLARNLDTGILSVPDGILVEQLLSADDRNRFMFAVDAVRRRYLTSSRAGEDSMREDEADPKSVGEEPMADNTVFPAKFPPLYSVTEVSRLATSGRAFESIDAQEAVLGVLSRYAGELGDDLLSRCDPEYPDLGNFIKLKRNKYVLGAKRPRLPRVSPCGCAAVPVLFSGSGSSGKFSCSNDGCENRASKSECDASLCPAGKLCQNQRLQKMQVANFEVVSFGSKGFGVVAKEGIPAGTLIGEYQGEIVDEKEFLRRREEYGLERHFYFMVLSTGLYIDASRYARSTRFINHCCEPNAETQKWTAGREERVGIFAKADIAKGDEITFDYGTKGCSAKYERPVRCLCGAKLCRGYLIPPSNEQDPEADSLSLFQTGTERRNEAEKREEKIQEGRKLLVAEYEIGESMNTANVSDGRENVSVAPLTSEVCRERVRQWLSRSFSVVCSVPAKTANGSSRGVRIPRKAPGGSAVAGSALEAVPSESGVDHGRFGEFKKPPFHFGKPLKPLIQGRRSADHRSGRFVAPRIRNRPVSLSKFALNDSDSEASFGEYSESSHTVPVSEDYVYVPASRLGQGACPDNEFVEASPLPSLPHKGDARTPAMYPDVEVTRYALVARTGDGPQETTTPGFPGDRCVADGMKVVGASHDANDGQWGHRMDVDRNKDFLPGDVANVATRYPLAIDCIGQYRRGAPPRPATTFERETLPEDDHITPSPQNFGAAGSRHEAKHDVYHANATHRSAEGHLTRLGVEDEVYPHAAEAGRPGFLCSSDPREPKAEASRSSFPDVQLSDDSRRRKLPNFEERGRLTLRNEKRKRSAARSASPTKDGHESFGPRNSWRSHAAALSRDGREGQRGSASRSAWQMPRETRREGLSRHLDDLVKRSNGSDSKRVKRPSYR